MQGTKCILFKSFHRSGPALIPGTVSRICHAIPSPRIVGADFLPLIRLSGRFARLPVV